VRLDGIRVEAPPAPSPPRPSSPRGRGGRNTKNHTVVVVLAVLFVLGVPVRRGGVWASEIILKAGHVTMPSATGSAPGIDEARVTQEVPVKSALRRLALLLLVLPLGLSRPAAATTYMMMSDRALA